MTPEEKQKRLEEIRDQIDRIDAQLVELLSQRAQCAIEVGKVKGTDNTPFFTPERERRIYNKLAKINQGP
ncbi:MAG: chorismate mutase, partial [Fimbriimonadaceae bacterium]